MSEVALFSLDEMPELAFPNDARILADWRVSEGLPLKV
jgi:hypothetical protein